MYLTARQLAKESGISVKTVYNLMNSGELPEGVKFGKSRRWDWDKVQEWINNHGGKNDI